MVLVASFVDLALEGRKPSGDEQQQQQPQQQRQQRRREPRPANLPLVLAPATALGSGTVATVFMSVRSYGRDALRYLCRRHPGREPSSAFLFF